MLLVVLVLKLRYRHKRLYKIWVYCRLAMVLNVYVQHYKGVGEARYSMAFVSSIVTYWRI